MVKAFTSLTSLTNTVTELCGLDSSTKVMPWRDLPKGREVNVIPWFPIISFWTLVKILPADGAPTGCQAGWAKAGPLSSSVPRTASQSLPGKARKHWSPTTSPALSPGCLLGSRGEAWGVQPLWTGLTSPDPLGFVISLETSRMWTAHLSSSSSPSSETSPHWPHHGWGLGLGWWAPSRRSLARGLWHPSFPLWGKPVPASGEPSSGVVSHRRQEWLGGFGARARSYSNSEVNFICTQSQHM